MTPDTKEKFVAITQQDINHIYNRMVDALKLGRTIIINYTGKTYICDIEDNEKLEATTIMAESLSDVLAASMKAFVEEIQEEQN